MHKIIGLVIVAAIAVGAYGVFHKSSDSTVTPASKAVPATKKIVQTKTDSTVGQYLADNSGFALYTYGPDQPDVSNCSGSCLVSWPAYNSSNAPSSLPTNVTVITRSDGTTQYAYKSLPLYYFYGEPAGVVTGDGVHDFHIAKP